MIICHRHRFIFLKTKKTAGTSLEIALSRHCGPDDVITDISPEDERERHELGYRGPQNTAVPLLYYRPWDLVQVVRRRSRLQYRNHTGAAWLRRHVSRAVWEGYFKFCVDRNPWDRAISSYYWRNRHASQRQPFDVWLGSVGTGQISNFDIYSIRGRVAVDRVLRYEHLEADLKEVANHLKLPEELVLPRAKGQYRVDRRPYREVLEPAQRDRIAAVCAREIELLGYEF